MKSRIVLAAALMTLTAGSVFAQKTEKTVDEVRIYINPGHGSWTANDRPMQTIGREAYSSTDTDTTGFFESNTNLQKGFAVYHTLRLQIKQHVITCAIVVLEKKPPICVTPLLMILGLQNSFSAPQINNVSMINRIILLIRLEMLIYKESVTDRIWCIVGIIILCKL